METIMWILFQLQFKMMHLRFILSLEWKTCKSEILVFFLQ